MVNLISLLYMLIMFGLVIALFIAWLRLRKELRPYREVGLSAAVLFVLFELVVLATIPRSAPLTIPIWRIVAIDVIGFLKIAIVTMVGIHMAARLGYRSFPLLKPELGVLGPEPSRESEPEEPDPDDPFEIGAYHDAEVMVPAEADVSPETPPFPNEADPRPVLSRAGGVGYLLTVVGVAVGASAYSMVLFWLTSPRMSELAKHLFGRGASDDPYKLTVAAMIALVEVAFAEELLFRLGIQNFLAKGLHWEGGRYWIAITLTAGIWTLGHAGLLNPNWVKLAQVFPIGIVLGWLFKRLGTEACIMSHVLFNLIMAVSARLVIK